MDANEQQFNVRQATEVDLPALAGIKAPEALHRDRLRDADGEQLLYLIIEEAGAIIGFGLLVFVRPATWPDAGDTTRLPAMVDLHIRSDRRIRGPGRRSSGKWNRSFASGAAPGCTWASTRSTIRGPKNSTCVWGTSLCRPSRTGPGGSSRIRTGLFTRVMNGALTW